MSDVLIFRLALLCMLMACGQSVVADELDNPPPLEPSLQRAAQQPRLRVALVDSGVNYLLPQINGRLARSEAGKLIGYDFWDMDARPFDSHPRANGGVQRHGTRTASILLKEAPFVELVSYRYPRPDMSRMTDLIQHADENGVRVIGLPLGGNLQEKWQAFERAAKAHPHILFVVSAGNNGRDIDQQPVYPAALTLENMLVVTSADDFGQLADGVNWGRTSVDYMVPAEALKALKFDGSEGLVAGSSYAVPRVVALAARFLRNDRSLDALQVMKLIRQKFANGSMPRRLAKGYIHDPQYDESASVSIAKTYPFQSLHDIRPSDDTVEHTADLTLPIQVLVLDDHWKAHEILDLLKEVEQILGQCDIALASGDVERVQSPDYLRDLESGAAKTLMEKVRISGPDRKLTIVFARDTLMKTAFDAEAFGRGNTRQRPWLTDSVWLTLALQDRSIALAHELFHVLVNSGQHSAVEGSLMLARTTGSNTRLTTNECGMARARALDLGLLQPRKLH